MRELEIDLDTLRAWFHEDPGADTIASVVRVPAERADAWLAELAEAVRRCYVSDEVLDRRAQETGASKAELIEARLPDPGPVMSGDFGEILAFLFLGAEGDPDHAIGPKKWRLKQDRSKPAPHTDVVQFVVPSWPASSPEDRLLCAEVKTKSTAGTSTPISSAIQDSEKDRLGRLATTLVWLRERALFDDSGGAPVAVIERFLNTTDHPHAEQTYWAIAVICSSLVADELLDVPETMPEDCLLVVIDVPELKRRYEEVFAAARQSADEGE